jgi:FtsH-binding integral membrane protein
MPAIARHVLALVCLVSGGVHLSLIHGHADTEPVLAAGFVTAGAVLALAGTLALTGRDMAIGPLLLLAGLVGAYAVDRTVGLPLATSHGATHGGADALGLAIEGIGVAAALVLLRMRKSRRFRHAFGTDAVRPAA